MGYRHCLDRIRRADPSLTDDQIAAIFERIHKTALDIKAGRSTGAKPSKAGEQVDNIITQAAKEAAAQLQAEAAQKQRQAQLQVTRLSGRMRDVDAMVASGVNPLDAVELAIRRDYSGKVNIESLEQRATAHQAYFKMRLRETWDALGNDWLGFFQSKPKLLTLIRELRGEDTGDALAKKGAKAFHDVAEEARQVFNEAGGDIGKLDDWGMPQHHSQEKVALAGRDAWVNAILPMLDRSRYADDLGQFWDDGRMREFLAKAWDSIATDGHANVEAGQYRGTGKRANRHAEHRQIHFKDADANIKYWEQFGERTAAEILLSHIESMGKDIAFIEHFGPNPNVTYATLRDGALQAAVVANPAKKGQLEGRAVKLDILYDYAAGRIKPTANQTLSKVADGTAHLNVAGKLGGSMLASLFGDKPIMEAVSHLNNLPALQRWRTELALLNPVNGADRRLLQQQGLMLDGIRSGLTRFYEGLGQTGTTGKLANAVMRITGMQAINEIRKGAFGASLMSAIGHEIKAGKGFMDLADSDIRTLRNYGITENDWNIWKLAKLQDIGHGNEAALTPEAIARIPDAEIAKVVGHDIQSAKQQIGDQIAELVRRNAEEDARLQSRKKSIQEAEARAARRLNEFMSTRDARLAQAGEMFQARIEIMRAKVERAEVEADMNAYLLQERQRGETTRLVDAVMEGKNVEKALALADKQGDRASRQRGAIAEKFGERRGNTERRIIEIEGRLRQMERDADAEIKGKFEELSASFQKQIDAVDEWYKRSLDRVSRRESVVERLMREAEAAEQQIANKARRDAIVKLLGAVNTESDFAIVTPGWKERAQFYGDIQRGTFKGEITRSVLQFKSFPWTAFKRMADAVANKDTPVSKAAMTAYLVAATTLAGAMLMQTREMLAGKDPRNMFNEDAPKFWSASFLAGGALGIYGDFLYSANQTRYGSGPLEMLAGPTVGPLLELGLVQPLQAARKTMEGKETHLLAQTAQDLKGFVPGGNIWYTKAAFDHLIFQQVFEALSPGYLDNIRSRTQQEFGQDWWWSPGELTPERAPDLSQAIGQ